jgi:hypothetical protein
MMKLVEKLVRDSIDKAMSPPLMFLFLQVCASSTSWIEPPEFREFCKQSGGTAAAKPVKASPMKKRKTEHSD